MYNNSIILYLHSSVNLFLALYSFIFSISSFSFYLPYCFILFPLCVCCLKFKMNTLKLYRFFFHFFGDASILSVIKFLPMICLTVKQLVSFGWHFFFLFFPFVRFAHTPIKAYVPWSIYYLMKSRPRLKDILESYY